MANEENVIDLYTRADDWNEEELVHEIEVKFRLSDTALNVFRRNAASSGVSLDEAILGSIHDDTQEYLWRYGHHEYDHKRSLEWNIAYYNGELNEHSVHGS